MFNLSDQDEKNPSACCVHGSFAYRRSCNLEGAFGSIMSLTRGAACQPLEALHDHRIQADSPRMGAASNGADAIPVRTGTGAGTRRVGPPERLGERGAAPGVARDESWRELAVREAAKKVGSVWCLRVPGPGCVPLEAAGTAHPCHRRGAWASLLVPHPTRLRGLRPGWRDPTG